MENYPSKLLENALNEFAKLPGVGKRTALRFALHVLKQEEKEIELFAKNIYLLRSNVKYCRSCHSISDNEICDICNYSGRNKSLVCVVEDVRDVMAIENTQQYNGLYHVLGGIISPIEGIGIQDLNIDTLLEKVKTESITEVILALPTTIEGDTTNFYINKQLKNFDVTVSTIARGISIGDSLEFADEVTLGRSIQNRMLFDNLYKVS